MACGPTRWITAIAAVQALNVGSHALTDSFTVLTQDGTAQMVNITITGSNDAAVITGDAQRRGAGSAAAWPTARRAMPSGAGDCMRATWTTRPTRSRPGQPARRRQRLRQLRGDGARACGPTRWTTAMRRCRRSTAERRADRQLHGDARSTAPRADGDDHHQRHQRCGGDHRRRQRCGHEAVA